jgi:hypothetical protein
MLAIVLPSHASDGAGTHGCNGCGKVGQPLGALRCCHNVKKSDIHVGS